MTETPELLGKDLDKTLEGLSKRAVDQIKEKDSVAAKLPKGPETVFEEAISAVGELIRQMFYQKKTNPTGESATTPRDIADVLKEVGVSTSTANALVRLKIRQARKLGENVVRLDFTKE